MFGFICPRGVFSGEMQKVLDGLGIERIPIPKFIINILNIHHSGIKIPTGGRGTILFVIVYRKIRTILHEHFVGDNKVITLMNGLGIVFKRNGLQINHTARNPRTSAMQYQAFHRVRGGN